MGAAPSLAAAAADGANPPSPTPAKVNASTTPTYTCTCGRGPFITLGGLRAHSKLHGIGRPHQCRTCGIAFQRKQDLKRHELSHAESKPFLCSCGSGFSRSDALHRHMRTYGCAKAI
ncbi:hypothetical protein DFJ73DRAFT_637060 [Zopfochytrium polystomum]|nr:hypothetical protein DFJ73DRAFT_637060 [Zopfochytrium polystomum]